MKVIELLNKIANKEKVPNKIMYDNIIYNWDEVGYLHYKDEMSGERAFLEGVRTDMVLNNKIKVIEENKEIEELKNILNKLSETFDKAYDKLMKESEEK